MKKEFDVFAITPERRDRAGEVIRREGEGYWPIVGKAWENTDGSFTVQLDALPVGGKLQMRPAEDRTRKATNVPR